MNKADLADRIGQNRDHGGARMAAAGLTSPREPDGGATSCLGDVAVEKDG